MSCIYVKLSKRAACVGLVVQHVYHAAMLGRGDCTLSLDAEPIGAIESRRIRLRHRQCRRFW
jgi:hypothetical protein